jgi:hypothetical protein
MRTLVRFGLALAPNDAAAKMQKVNKLTEIWGAYDIT